MGFAAWAHLEIANIQAPWHADCNSYELKTPVSLVKEKPNQTIKMNPELKSQNKKSSRFLLSLIAAIAIGSTGALTSCANNTQTGALVGGLGGAAIGGAAKGKKGAIIGGAAGAAGGALIGNHKDRHH